jgi:hypothetical protein
MIDSECCKNQLPLSAKNVKQKVPGVPCSVNWTTKWIKDPSR